MFINHRTETKKLYVISKQLPQQSYVCHLWMTIENNVEVFINLWILGGYS
jgi:hypothetical protein